MCLAIPGKVKKVLDKKVLIKYPSVEREAFLGDANVKPGDYVLVQMGVVSRILSEEDALEMQKAWSGA